VSSRRPHHAALGKLSVPRLGRVFDRRRLFELLDDLSGVPGIWLVAPPGAGKTTLVATWRRASRQPTLWLRVDADDADPATFVRALDSLCASLLGGDLELPPLRGEDFVDLTGSLRRRMRHLLPQLPPCWTLVLDNLQELPVASTLQMALADLLVELPPGVQWIFVSRSAPPPAFSRLLASQLLRVIDPELLRFDAAETRELIRLHGHSEAMVEPLDAAQGWAAGMVLMLLGRGDGTPAPAQSARERLFDYFADEVLSRMPPEHQRTLSMLAFLPSVSAELAVALTGQADAPELLERLAAASLFTDRRGDGPTVFAFHALFGDFLRRRFARAASPEEVRALRCQCGRLLMVAGDVDAGLQRLLEAEAWDEAESWIRRSAPRYVDEGRVLGLRKHIDGLPGGASERLAYWRGACALEIDPEAALADMTLAHRMAIVDGDIQGQLEAAAGAAVALLTIGRLSDLDPWIGVLETHQANARHAFSGDADLRFLPGLLAALVHHMPWHPMTEVLAERAERLAYRKSGIGQRFVLGALAFHFLYRGQLERLEPTVLRIDTMYQQGLDSPQTVMRWWGLGIQVKSLLGQVASARIDAERALAAVEAEPLLASQRANAELLAGFVAMASHDAAALRWHLQRAAKSLHPERAIDRSAYQHELAVLALLEGDGPEALRLMPAATSSARLSGYAVREHITLIAHALAAAYNDQHDVACGLLEQVRLHPMFAVCRWHQWIGGCVAAYAALRRDDSEGANVALRMAFGVAREYGFRYGPLLFACADLMPRLAASALNAGIEPEIARDLVARHELKPPASAGASWPWPVRIRALGTLDVEIDGVTMTSSRKASRRLAELLSLLAAQGETPISQERVADQLWPDADGDAARNSLDNALHRLRKALGGEDRVLLRHGALSLNLTRCWSDVRATEQLVRQLEAAAASKLPLLLDQLRATYRAPLLPDEGFESIVSRRRGLQREVERALRLAASRLDEAGMYDAAQLVRQSLLNL
jgi:hypothetical protein